MSLIRQACEKQIADETQNGVLNLLQSATRAKAYWQKAMLKR